MVTKSEAISAFLSKFTHSDLSELYNLEMECQVNVAHDGGQRIEGEYQGRQWHGWTDGLQTWKSFRIPHNANTTPTYDDKSIKFDLALHVEGIGMTGWNWVKRKSMWVAFDFDAISGHSEKHGSKLSPDALKEVEAEASKIPWITIRKSTSGKGLHLYVFLDGVDTENHNEHAALARAILGKTAALTGFEFASKVDVCGGNMWVWHRKMKGTDGLQLIKQGEKLYEVPPNWRDHVKVVTSRRRKIIPKDIEGTAEQDVFEALTGCRNHVTLDDAHKSLIKYLEDNSCQHWWDADNHMLVCHTYDLKQAHNELNLRGIFDTESEGTERGIDHNCFCFPMRKGSWVVRRFTPGVKEASTWEQDGEGWTRCYLNLQPTLATASKHLGGIENDKGSFEFREAELAAKAASLLGGNVDIPNFAVVRNSALRQHKDGRLIFEFTAEANDPPDKLKGWLKKKDKWMQILNVQISAPTENDVGNYDDLLRHVVDTNNSDAGWMLYSDALWNQEPLTHIEKALFAMNLQPNEIKTIVGNGVIRPWRLANIPFQPEYPGGRIWNRDAAQLRFMPSVDVDALKYPTWLKILDHCGKNLTPAVTRNTWAQINGIRTGGDYLKCWIASLFKEPEQPLPYLFFYGDQNSGKSIFHEALQLLTTKGYVRADNALKSSSDFNAELEHAIICVVEETSLRKQTSAYERIKDWVTSRLLPIHRKTKTPYHVVNTTHWIQCSNDFSACPIFPGDTRITMIHVDNLPVEQLIPKKSLIPLLEKEAPDFLAAILNLELPHSPDRLNIPVIDTDDKEMAMEVNKTPVEQFIDECCYKVNGECIPFSDFYDKFINWLDNTEQHNWSKIRLGRSLPSSVVKGRSVVNNHQTLGNISFIDKQSTGGRYVVRDEKLILVFDAKPAN